MTNSNIITSENYRFKLITRLLFSKFVKVIFCFVTGIERYEWGVWLDLRYRGIVSCNITNVRVFSIVERKNTSHGLRGTWYHEWRERGQWSINFYLQLRNWPISRPRDTVRYYKIVDAFLIFQALNLYATKLAGGVLDSTWIIRECSWVSREKCIQAGAENCSIDYW